MGTIVTFGMPRSGTTFMEAMFSDNKYVKALHLSSALRKINGEGYLHSDIKINTDSYKWRSTKIGEGTIYHPINSQIAFQELCDYLPQPIVVIRTKRSAENIYKSLLAVEGINIEPRFRAWDIESVCSAIISESAGWIGIRNLYSSFSIDFDVLNAMSTYFGYRLHTFGVDKEICDACESFIKNNYGNNPVRDGRLSTKKKVDITSIDKTKLLRVDEITARMESYL